MTDANQYKATLNLPQTAFPMKANLAQREPIILQKWADENLRAAITAACANRPTFILHMGPPYANGQIHLGGATNNILKDMIAKSKLLSGFAAPLVPGWDCHGLPIELNVEKKIGKPGRKVSAAEFRVACREYAQSFVDIQMAGFKRLGIIADWENAYLTMAYNYEADTVRSLATILEKHHIQRGLKPIYWCLDCGSALAEAEVEYADKTSLAIDVAFLLMDHAAFLNKLELDATLHAIYLPIWTTTPWSLPGNEALSVHPELNYNLVKVATDKAYVIAEDLVESTLKRYGVDEFQILATFTGSQLYPFMVKHPFYEKTVPIILGNHVTADSGTGVVHTAPAHGQDDYIVGKQYDLPVANPVGGDGCYLSTTPLFAGVHLAKANPLIIEKLKEQGALLHEAKLTHSYPHCWRHHTPLVFMATPQWFISMEAQGLRPAALEEIKNVTWVPNWGEARITGMIENRPDWCISRQRAWGVPLCFIIHKETNELHPDMPALMEKIAQLIEKDGIEAWYTVSLTDLLGSEAEQYQKTNDVLDVWFDSGVSQACVLQKRDNLTFPADLVLEGSDQHRGWFQSSLLTSMAMQNAAPYKTVLTHGFVVDGQGRKMSKSVGNVIAPDEIVREQGADVLRLWVASIDYRTEIAASKEIFTRTSETYRRIRNTARFLLANLHDFSLDVLLPTEKLLPLDRWMVAKTLQIQNEIIDAYTNYHFYVVVQKLHQFCVAELGGFYLDLIKDRQYTMQVNSHGRRSAQTALYHVAQAFVRWLAPILTFTAEEIWQFLPAAEALPSVFLATWYENLNALAADDQWSDQYWQQIRSVREIVYKEIENQRAAQKIGSGLEAEVTLYCNAELQANLLALENELRFVFITSSAAVQPLSAAPDAAMVTENPNLKILVAPTQNAKCVRCWHRVPDVGQNTAHPELCLRCVDNVDGSGEVRRFA